MRILSVDPSAGVLDPAAFVLLESSARRHTVLLLDQVKPDGIEDCFRLAVSLVDRHRPSLLVFDGQGAKIGRRFRQLLEDTEALDTPWLAIIPTPVKQTRQDPRDLAILTSTRVLAGAVFNALRREKLRCPPHLPHAAELRRQIASFQVTQDEVSGTFSFRAPKGQHDDIFFALAGGLFVAESLSSQGDVNRWRLNGKVSTVRRTGQDPLDEDLPL